LETPALRNPVRIAVRHIEETPVSEERSESPVESASSSLAFDENKRQIELEQKPGEQPVTVAGGALGPIVDAEGAEDPRPSD
jgi:hypothetical protein